MINFGKIPVYQQDTVRFAIGWQGESGADTFGNVGWERLPVPLKSQVREGYAYNAEMFYELSLEITNSEVYGTNGALIFSFAPNADVKPTTYNFDLFADGVVFGYGRIEVKPRVTEEV
jgi:hypothetical protein